MPRDVSDARRLDDDRLSLWLAGAYAVDCPACQWVPAIDSETEQS